MKKFWNLILAALAVASLAACGSSKADAETNADAGISNLPLGMYMSVESVENGVVTLVVDNQSGYAMTYTEVFTLEVLNGEVWEEVPYQEGVEAPENVYSIADLEQATLSYDLTAMYGELPAGTYRLTQEDMQVTFEMQ